MMYFLPTGSNNMHGMSPRRFGVIRDFRGGNAWGIKNGYTWIADNGAFTDSFTPGKFLAWLISMLPWLSTCLFVVVPDILYNPLATLDRYRWWAWRLKILGYPVAFVAQDGQEDCSFPPEYDYLFIGGSTDWKMGAGTVRCIDIAKANGKPVHVGRVNSLPRLKYFSKLGVKSVDGTHWIYEPDRAKEHMQDWLRVRPLFTV